MPDINTQIQTLLGGVGKSSDLTTKVVKELARVGGDAQKAMKKIVKDAGGSN